MANSSLASLKLITNLLHAVDIAVLGVIGFLVLVSGKPGWLVLLVLPTMGLAMFFQYRLLKAEAAESAAPGPGGNEPA